MLAADVLDVAGVPWNGKLVEAVRNEYVLRMPQTNAATASSTLDYACKTPVVQQGWSLEALGSGFFKLTAPAVTQATLTAWASQQGAKSVDVNRVAHASKTPNDPLFGDPNNWAFSKIAAPQAWDTGTGTETTIVAVLDSGIDYSHADLAKNMWKNPNEIAGNGKDDDRNGVADDVYGYNALTNSGDPMDDFGHGTFIAGLVGAVGNNAVGMAGVNWTVKIMAVKVMDAAGAVSVANEVRGINYVMSQKMAGQNIVAINCSFGRTAFSQQESDALTTLAATGITIVAAAGNDANDNDRNPVYPANYDIAGLISVAASDSTDHLASFSNYGLTTVDLAAPGVGILSTRAKQASGPYGPYQTNDYTLSNDAFTQNEAFVDGTSCSAALVSGAAGLLKSLKPAASVRQVKDAILNGVDKFDWLKPSVVTGGRLNLKNSVDLILATTGALPVPSFVSGQALKYIEGNQGYTSVEIKVQLDRPCDPGKSCSVFYATQPGGSATAGVDYVATSGYVTFSGAEMQKSFFVKIIGDRVAEAEEQFAVQILRSKSSGIDSNTPLVQQVNAAILDDDNTTAPVQPGPTGPSLLPRVSIDVKRDSTNAAIPILEGGLATFVVSLDKTSTLPVSVKCRTNQPSLIPVGTALEGVDYVATSGTVTFKPGERTKEFTVKILADRVNDPTETFRVVLTEPQNADLSTGGGTNGGNASAAVTATITDVPYLPPPQPGFQVTVTFPDNSLTTSQQALFQRAATRWQEIIVGDLPNVTDPVTGQVIDDILILATGPSIDGPGGILGAAGPTDYRATDVKYGTPYGLPWKAVMYFDSADIATMEEGGTFGDVILHEMAHCLGFGYLWRTYGLLKGAGSDDPVFVGTNALREYRSIFGLPNATGIPVENRGGSATRDAHWRKTVFQTEIMTGSLEAAGTRMPISRITVGSLQDLGYTVNYARADAFTKPKPLPAMTMQTGPLAPSAGRPAVAARLVVQLAAMAVAPTNPSGDQSTAAKFRALSRSAQWQPRTATAAGASVGSTSVQSPLSAGGTASLVSG